MPSRTPNRLASSALYVESSVEKNDEVIDQALAERYSGLLEDGENLPDFKLMMRLIQRDLGRSRQTILASDVVNLEELADDPEYRRRRNELMQKIQKRINRWRGLFERAYDDSGRGLEIAGIEAETARDLFGVVQQGRRVVARCQAQVDGGFPAPDLKGVQLVPQEIVDDLDPACEELDTLVNTLNLEERERQTSQIDKEKSLDRHVDTFTPSAQVLQSFAGYPELAARVKPSVRRPGRREAEPPDGSEGDTDGGADTAPPPTIPGEEPPPVGPTPTEPAEQPLAASS